MNGYVYINAEKRMDYSTDEQFDSSQVTFCVEKKYNAVNHLICLWKQEDSANQILDLYTDIDGNIGQTQSLFGKDEVVGFYEDTSAETMEELEKSAILEMKEIREGDSLEVAFSSDEEGFDIGDIVGAIENFTQISMKAVIVKKIVKIKNGTRSVSYEIGDQK